MEKSNLKENSQISEKQLRRKEKQHLKEIKRNLKKFLEKLKNWKKENRDFLNDLPTLPFQFLHSKKLSALKKKSVTLSSLSFSQLLSHPLFGILPSYHSSSHSSSSSSPNVSLPSFSGRECVDWIFEL